MVIWAWPFLGGNVIGAAARPVAAITPDDRGKNVLKIDHLYVIYQGNRRQTTCFTQRDTGQFARVRCKIVVFSVCDVDL